MKQMYLNADENGLTYLHFAATQNTRLAFTMFLKSVKEGDANIQELRRINANGHDPISLAVMHGHFDLVDFILNKLFAEFPNEAREICETPIVKDSKTLRELVVADMLEENYVLAKFSMLGDDLPKIAARLVILEVKITGKIDKKHSTTALGAVITSADVVTARAKDALSEAQRALKSASRSSDPTGSKHF